MKLGAHESVSGGVQLAVDRAIDDGCESIQIFVKSPNRWVGAELKEKEISAFKEKASKFGISNITSHTAYLINLASPDDETHNKSREALLDEMKRCDKLGVRYNVLHPGSPLDSGEEAGIKRVIQGLDYVYSHDINATVLLEITAGMGNSIGGKFEQLQKMCEGVKNPDKVGICLDTCHMFSSGYDIVNDYEGVMKDFFARLGDKLKVFHLNDSKFGLHARKDRHELLGKGYIGLDTFVNIVNDSRMKGVLGILETPIGKDSTYKEELDLLKSLRKN